jgi:hypothetical protein
MITFGATNANKLAVLTELNIEALYGREVIDARLTPNARSTKKSKLWWLLLSSHSPGGYLRDHGGFADWECMAHSFILATVARCTKYIQ